MPNDDDSSNKHVTQLLLPDESHLCLPSTIGFAVSSNYLATIPSIQAANATLLKRAVVSYSASSNSNSNSPSHSPSQLPVQSHSQSHSQSHTFSKPSPALVYVHQGEVAHALSTQDCDLLVSDKATTCHIMALHSFDTNTKSTSTSTSTNSSSTNRRMTSLTHLDSTDYEKCVRQMIQKHQWHPSPDSTTDPNFSAAASRTLQVNIVGGFDDAQHSSERISQWLLALLVDIAQEQDRQKECTRSRAGRKVHLQLQACVISAMNTNTWTCTCTSSSKSSKRSKMRKEPMARGLAICTRTGKVHLAHVDSMKLMGPHALLKNARLWASLFHQEQKQDPIQTAAQTNRSRILHCIHSTDSNNITITPFYFQPLQPKDFHRIMSLPDHLLLKETSSSPEVEDEHFCQRVRDTFVFMQQHDCHELFFGKDCSSDNDDNHFKFHSTTTNQTYALQVPVRDGPATVEAVVRQQQHFTTKRRRTMRH